MASGRVITCKQEAFSKLKPACVGLLRNPSLLTLRALNNLLGSLHPSLIADIPEFLLHPVAVILKRGNVTEEKAIAVCSTIRIVLGNGRVGLRNLRPETFFSILENVLQLAVEKTADGLGVRKVTEEVQIAVMTTLSSMIEHMDTDLLEKLLSPDHLACLGYSLLSASMILENVKAPEVRFRSLEYLRIVASCGNGRENLEVSFLLGAHLSDVLPGLASKVTGILRKHSVEGLRVVEAALECWSSLMEATLSDAFLDRLDEERKKASSGWKPSCYGQDWQQKSLASLGPLIGASFNALVVHHSWKIRLKLTIATRRFVENCRMCSASCLTALVETTVRLCQDEWEKVSKEAKKTLEFLVEQFSGVDEVLQESLFHQMTVLPRTRNGADVEQLAVLRTAEAILNAWDESDLASFWRCQMDLRSLLNSMLDFIELDANRSIMEASIQPLAPGFSVIDESHDDGVKRFFTHFENHKVADACKRVFMALGSSGSCEDVVHALVDVVKEGRDVSKEAGMNRRKEALVAVRWVLQGHAQRLKISEDAELRKTRISKPTMSQTCCDLLDLLALEEKKPARASIRGCGIPGTENEDVLVASLAMDVIAGCSEVMSSDFSPFLVKVLSPITALTCHPNRLVNSAAGSSLRVMARSCGYDSPIAFVGANMDYVLNDLILSFSRGRDHARATLLFTALAQCCGPESPQLLAEVVDQAVESLEKPSSKGDILQLHVMHEFARALLKCFPPSEKPALEHKPSPKATLEDRVRKLLQDEQDQEPEELVDGERDADGLQQHTGEGADEIPMQQEAKKEVPRHIKQTADVMRRCSRLLEKRSLPLDGKIVALQTIGDAVAVLSSDPDYTDELLPAVHDSWPGVAFTFRLDPDLPARRMALLLIVQLADACGDFLRQRVTKEILPVLRTFLEQETKRFQDRNIGRRYAPLSSDYRLMLNVLTGLGTLAHSLQLTVGQVAPLLRTAAACIVGCNDAEIKARAVELLRSVGKRHREAVWHTVLAYIRPRHQLAHPSSTMFTVHQVGRTDPTALVQTGGGPNSIDEELVNLVNELGFEHL